MKILIIQENGRHELNRNFRECFSLKRGFEKLGFETVVWGLGHLNYGKEIDFNSFDLILNLENYDGGWVPNISKVKSVKLLWSIDAHVRGENCYINEFNRGNYNLLLHSTKDYVNENFKVWLPNAFDDELIKKRDVEKKCDIGFCGNVVNRKKYLQNLSKRYDFIHDEFVIGDDMVNAINSYKIHWNKNIYNDINYRNFETIGCGVPLVTSYNENYESLGFKHMENIVIYKTDEEMYEYIDILLSDKVLREKISINGFFLSKKHTYTERCKKIIEIYNQVL